MKKLLTAANVEWLKIKGLGLTYLAVIIGALIPILFFLEKLFITDGVVEERLPYSVFQDAIMQNVQGYMFYLMLIFIIIVASRIAQIDHKNNCWQLMETQPVKRTHIYFSKYIVLLRLSFLCITSFFIFSIILSFANFYIHPEPSKLLTFDVLWMLETYLKVCFTILGIAAFQLCISVAFPGFIWSFLAGILGLILNLVSLGKAESYLFSPYNSLYIFWNSADVRNLNSFISFSEYLSFFWAILFLMIGYFWYAGKGIKGAFLASNRKITFSVLFVLIASGVFYMVQKPSAYKAGKEGITIHGKLDTNLKIDSIKIYTADFHKEIASIPVQNNTFAWTSTKNLPFDEYVMEYAGKNVKLMMGSGDWFDLLIQCDAASNDIFMKSNRKAEQSYQEQENFGRSFSIILDKDSPEDPKTFYDVAQSDWKDNIKKLNKYTNAENQALSDEYKEYRKQLLAIRYLNEINNYRKITSLSDPKFAAPKEFLEELNENIQKPTYLLNKNEEYLQYKLDKVFEDNGSPNPDSILFTKLDLLPKGLDRDRLLAKHLKKNIELEPDSTSRNKIFAAQINKIQNQDYKNMLYSSLEQINLSQKGSPFPDLILENDKGKTIKLSKYKGKYVVIDIWASWCAPCKTIRPVFETRSYQNRYVDNIQFISVSVDADKGKWINSLKAKPSQIPQYWLPNPEKLMDKYKIQTIPRFIIVDPEGKIFNLNTPFPDEDNFVEILDKLKKY